MYLTNSYFASMVRIFSAVGAVSLLLSASAPHVATRFPFAQNKGQWPPQVVYRTLTGQGALFVERDALTFVLRSGTHAHGHEKAEPAGERHEHAYRVHFVGGKAGSHEGLERLPYYENYF